MWRFVSGQLRHRPHRGAVLAGAILVAACAFVLLASAARTSELKVKGSVKSSFRPAYDILVRPVGSKTVLERDEGLVRPNFLSGVYGGISFGQWREIERIRDVAVAAPVANVGYILAGETFPVSISKLVSNAPAFQLYRIRQIWVANGGHSRYPGPDLYIYYTPGDVFTSAGPWRDWLETGPNVPRPLPSCGGFSAEAPLEAVSPFPPLDSESTLACFPTEWKANGFGAPISVNGLEAFESPRSRGYVGTNSAAYFPVYITAIDPVQEAKLVDLDRTIVHGRYLRPNEGLSPYQLGTGRNLLRYTTVPVLASTRTYVDERLDLTVERLRIPPGTNMPRLLATGTCPRNPCPAPLPPPAGSPYRSARAFVESLRGQAVERRSIPLSAVYRHLLRTPPAPSWKPGIFAPDSYWTTSPTRYRRVGPDRLAPLQVRNPEGVWTSGFSGFYTPPRDNLDPQFRRLHDRVSANEIQGTRALWHPLRIVGEFDPSKLPGFSPLSKVPLETYYPPELEPAGAASRRALGGRPLLPTQNLGDYIQQPPLLLTTMQGLQAFLDPKAWVSHTTGASLIPATQRRAPISAIRVKVAGVRGPDPLSVARIKAVALKIHERTGLDVDITAGSSPHPVTIDLPKGRFGRPPLVLSEGWSKKGVSVSFLQAVDRKDVILFALIPLVCALFLGNAALAVVRGRRAEIGTLLTLGWSRLAIFRAVLGELALIGLAAGLLGAGLSAVLVSALSLQAALWRTVLVIPLSVALALAAGLLAGWRAAAGSPLDAVLPPVAGRIGRWHARGFLSLALLNLRRLPWRSAVALAGLVLGVAALTVILGVERGFQGTLVGTLLGNAISVQISGYDFLSVALTIALACCSLADVQLTNLRERSAELVALRTTGWADRHLARLIALEALALGLAGSLTGAVVGLVVVAAIGAPIGTLLPYALLAAFGGTLVALAASLLPLAYLSRLQPAVVFAEA